MTIWFETTLYGCFALIRFRDKDLFQFVQVDILDGRLEKILQGIVQRTFSASIFAIDKQVFAAHLYFVSAEKSLVIGDFDGPDFHGAVSA